MEIKRNKNPQEIFTKEQIKDTPFLVIYNPDKKLAFGVFGQYRITKDFENPEEVKNELTIMTWDKIITVMSLVYEMLKSQEKTQTKTVK